MITVNETIYYQNKASLYLQKANITTNSQQIKSIEIADFNLNDFEKIGLSILINDSESLYKISGAFTLVGYF